MIEGGYVGPNPPVPVGVAPAAVLARVAALEAENARLRAVETCARDLYEAVEMAESVGICLPDRVSVLALGDALGWYES